MCHVQSLKGGVAKSNSEQGGLAQLIGKTSEDFRFIFTDREAIGKNKQKIRSHLGPVAQVSGRLCEAKPEAKSPCY